MEIITGKIQSPQKVVVYGPEGIGKTTFASKFPSPVFIDTEGSTKHLDVARTQTPSSWPMLLEQVEYFAKNRTEYETLVIDTADWAERLCIVNLLEKNKKSGIEDFGYGKGYTYLTEEFGRLLNFLNEVISNGMNVVLTAHAKMRKFEQPDETGSYDRWELKLQKQSAPLVKEWADMVLFANYKTTVVNVDGQGAEKGKNKVQGGKRVMYTTHHPCWDAKNRHELENELPFDFSKISSLFQKSEAKKEKAVTPEKDWTRGPIEDAVTGEVVGLNGEAPKPFKAEETGEQISMDKKEDNRFLDLPPEVPTALADLMKTNKVPLLELQSAVSAKGYYPEKTPFKNYAQDFVNGVLIGAWPQLYKFIVQKRINESDIPF